MNFRFTLSTRNVTRVTETPRVFVVDGDAAARQSMEALIRSAGYQPRVAASAEEFLEHPRGLNPGCLIVEPHLPGMNGLDLQRKVADRLELPIIFLARCADVTESVQAMKAGAFDFLTQPFPEQALLLVLNQAIDRSRAELRQMEQVNALQQRFESLSRREREVMSLVVTGRLNKQVGGQLGISEITVKAHRGKLMRKMQAGSFAELVNMAANLPNGSETYAAQE